ncbi:putative trehalase-like [Hibiscus syriacus]|uniref:Trehalase-like n=1 Tax=Hibiscus syriacus TaxID=106335 RepID=A0A6A3CMM3_HIBSY|nr:putative trehalase-like [Hibiscus syriacus]
MEMLETVKYLIGSRGASGFGSKSTADQVTETCPDLRSITANITGNGISAETAWVLAKRGARLVLPARNLKAAEETKARSFLTPRSSNNAGKFAHEHAISEDGIEMTFATNYLGKNRERVVSINGWFSGNMIGYLGQISRNKSEYDATRAYALSKLANVLHTKELAQRLKEMGANVTINCVHPGIVKTRLTREREGFFTDLVFFVASKLLKTIPQAASTTCYVATHPRVENVSGKYFAGCNEARTSKLASTPTEASRLWAASEIMVSVPLIDHYHKYN